MRADPETTIRPRGHLLRLLTQNIDGLECFGNFIPEEKVEYAHGNFNSAHVVGTEEAVDPNVFREAVLGGEPAWTRMIESHGGVVKPGIVLFDDPLPNGFLNQAKADMERADIVFIIGTSLKVSPCNQLIGHARKDVRRVYCNLELPDADKQKELGFDFFTRDFFIGGPCDQIAEHLADKLGLKDRMQTVYKAMQSYPVGGAAGRAEA